MTIADFVVAVDASPRQRGLLRDPATPETVESLRAALGLEAEAPLLAFYRAYDGSSRGAHGSQHLVLGTTLLSASEVIETKAHWDGLAARFEALTDPAAQTQYMNHALWNRAWVPLAENDNRITALALAPCFGGPALQVVSFDFKAAEGWSIWPSYDVWIAMLTAVAEADLLDAESGEPRLTAILARFPRRAVDLGGPLATRFEAGTVEAPRPATTQGIEVGASVRITQGKMAGMSGLVRARQGQTLVVEANIFGRMMPVEVDIAGVALSESPGTPASR